MNYYFGSYYGGLGYGLGGFGGLAMATALSMALEVMVVMATPVPLSVADTGHLDITKSDHFLKDASCCATFIHLAHLFWRRNHRAVPLFGTLGSMFFSQGFNYLTCMLPFLLNYDMLALQFL